MIRIIILLATIFAIQLASLDEAHSQDPSGVFGYIVITDPGTGERWLPRDDAGTLLGYISTITVVFRSRTGGGEARTIFENTGGTATFPTHVRYEIVFNYSYISRTDPPVALGRSGASSGPRQIQYNPDVWQYDRIEMGRWTWGAIPLSRRASPFPDLR